MDWFIGMLKDCIKRNRPFLIRPENAIDILQALGIRTWIAIEE